MSIKIISYSSSLNYSILSITNWCSSAAARSQLSSAVVSRAGPISHSYLLYKLFEIVGTFKHGNNLFSAVHPIPACEVPKNETRMIIVQNDSYNDEIIFIISKKIIYPRQLLYSHQPLFYYYSWCAFSQSAPTYWWHILGNELTVASSFQFVFHWQFFSMNNTSSQRIV